MSAEWRAPRDQLAAAFTPAQIEALLATLGAAMRSLREGLVTRDELAHLEATVRSQLEHAPTAPGPPPTAAPITQAAPPIAQAAAPIAQAAAPITQAAAPITEAEIAIIAAAVTAFLGKPVRVRGARRVEPIGPSAWAHQGRVVIQASHALTRAGGRR